jgi:hypothetical protein
MRWVLALVLMVHVAQASPADDVTKAFQGFVERGGANEPGLELFVPPGGLDLAEKAFVAPPVPPDASYVTDFLKAPTLSIQKLVVSPSGTSAWLAGEIKNAKPQPTLRVSALLVKDDSSWHVRAAHWSVPQKDAIPDIVCNVLSYEWHIQPGTPAELRGPVAAVLKAFSDNATSVLSDDKNAHMFGSAPRETYTGGRAIKKLFKKWHLSPDSSAVDKAANARAGIAPDGQLMWMSFGVQGSDRLCTMYRAVFILAKEKAGWRIVEQHYSKPELD